VALFDDTYAPYVPFGSRQLSVGDSGTDVAIAQAVYNLMLKTMNPPLGPMGSPIKIDGKYGSATQQAVRNIQSYFGLSVDGILGPNTFFVYGQGVGSHVTYGGPVYGSRQLETGMAGGDVTILQNRLNLFRYSSMIGKPASGTFDSATAAAVLAFKHDAEANGDTGFPDNSIVGYGTYDATWLYTFAGGRAIETGRNGFDVVFLQVLLKALGYYTGRITGYYDSATLASVRAFQTASGISVDGVVGPVTFYHLGLRNPHAAPTPLGIAWPTASEILPQVSDCCVVLTPQVGPVDGFMEPPGGSVWIRQFSTGGLATVTSTWSLPNPSTFGSCYDSYVLLFPSYPPRVLTLTDADQGIWMHWREQSYGSPLPPDTPITISLGQSFNITGPVVLQGNTNQCMSTTDSAS
jgi:peptidoglycan hydrolase-like protein with peptidoglycan-binding domain